jgi:hypothetical protein
VATTRGGPPRYTVILTVSGTLATHALQRLATQHVDVWEKAYLRNGLWISDGESTCPLSELSQVIQVRGTTLRITGGFLHSDLSRTIQRGVIVVAILYRCVLDELSGASKMKTLFAQMNNSLGGSLPKYQRVVRP